MGPEGRICVWLLIFLGKSWQLLWVFKEERHRYFKSNGFSLVHKFCLYHIFVLTENIRLQVAIHTTWKQGQPKRMDQIFPKVPMSSLFLQLSIKKALSCTVVSNINDRISVPDKYSIIYNWRTQLARQKKESTVMSLEGWPPISY